MILLVNYKAPRRQPGGKVHRYKKTKISIAHTPNPNRYLRAHRDRLLSELVALNGLPPTELARRYRRIKPQLGFVYRALANEKLLTRNQPNLNT